MNRLFFNWTNRYTTVNLVLLLCSTTLYAQETLLYSNLATQDLIGPRPSSSSEDKYLAQQFLTGENTHISRVMVQMLRVGTPTGMVHFEIWDTDDSGMPGQRVSTLGSVDLGSLGPTWQDILFEQFQDGLKPNSVYYLVANNTETSITSIEDSYRLATAPTDDGTYGAAKAMVSVPNMGWLTLYELLGDIVSYIRLEIASVSPSAYTLEVDSLGEGQVDVHPQLATYPAGTEVTLTAIPESFHSALVGWEGDATGQSDQTTLVMDSDKFVAAEFGTVIDLGPHRYAFGQARKSLGTAAVEEYPFITGDGLSMYFTALRYDLLSQSVSSVFRATRPNLDAAWGDPVDLMKENVNRPPHYNWVMEPSLTDDELSLYYLSALVNSPRTQPLATKWLVVHRDSRDVEFDFSQSEEVMAGSEDVGPGAITRDGTEFIFTSERAPGAPSYSVWKAPWDPVANDIGEYELVDGDSQLLYTDPEMSSDGLMVAFWHTQGGHALSMVARASTNDPWGEAVRLPASIGPGGGLTVSSDLTRIYFGSDRSDSTPADSRDPHFRGGVGYDIYEAKMRRLPLMGHWALDESSRASIAKDSVGSNDGVVLGRAKWQAEGGMVDGALLLDGTDDSVLLPSYVHPAGRPFSFYI
jgi:hypothetical protein